jgi:hypothetical protein
MKQLEQNAEAVDDKGANKSPKKSPLPKKASEAPIADGGTPASQKAK